MADIELVIKIDEEVYEFIKQNMTMDKVKDYHALLYGICEHIANGTPLPKGHGRLIDEERISLSGIHFETERDHAMMIGRLNSAATIIEADKE